MNNKLMALASILVAIGISQSAYSRCNPLYIGAQVGGCDLHYDNSKLRDDASSVDDKGLAGRLFTGFEVNQNIALELGYSMYQNPEFRYRHHVSTDFPQNSWDFLAKLSLPISCNVSVYGKAGMALVHRGDAEVVDDNVTVRVNDADNHLRPMLGVGVSYGFNSRVSGDLGYFRTFGTDDLGDADFYGAGITFRLS